MTTLSRVDQAYRSVVFTKFFSQGWGDPENLKKLFDYRKIIGNREECLNLVHPSHPVIIDQINSSDKDMNLIEGHLISPLVNHLPSAMPLEVQKAFFQLVVPKEWAQRDNKTYRPICIQLAGTGDHNFWRRRSFIAKPLLKEHGIGSLILENPFYGMRKPKNQYRSCLLNVSDVFVMGGSLILESIALMRWLEKFNYGPFILHGISMGGHMASLAATNWPKPISLAPSLSWSTASGVFTQGVLSGAIDWEFLENQYLTNNVYRDELSKMLANNRDELYRAGKKFARHFPDGYEYPGVHFPEDPPKDEGHWIPRKLHEIAMLKLFSRLSRPSPDGPPWADREEHVRKECLQFMRGIMDECTHLANFSVPVDTELIKVVAAKDDAYVPREGTRAIDDIWPGTEIRYVNAGHVSAYILHQSDFRRAIVDSLAAYNAKYEVSGVRKKIDGPGVFGMKQRDPLSEHAIMLRLENSTAFDDDESGK